MNELDVNTPKTINGYEVVDNVLKVPQENYYQDAYTLGQTKEQINIGFEVKKPKYKKGDIQTTDLTAIDRTYSLTFASSPDGKLWSIGINGLEKTFKVGFYNNDTLVMTEIAEQMQTWLGEMYIVSHTSGFTISINRRDGGEITKTSPNLTRKINLSGFDSISVITVTVDGVAVVLDGPTHSGDTSTAITYLKSQLSSSIYYMDDDGVDLIISRKDGAIPVLSYSSPNKYTYEVQYAYEDTPSVGKYPEYTTLTVDGTPYTYTYDTATRAYRGDKQVRNFYGWTQEEDNLQILSKTLSDTTKEGQEITTKYPITVNTVTKNSSCTATTAYIQTTGGTVLATASFSGDVATFNYDLFTGTAYDIVVDAGGSSYTNMYRNTGAISFPIVGELINFTDGFGSRFSAIETINVTYDGVNIANKTQSYDKSTGGSDSTWTSGNTWLYFNELHTLGLWNTDYSAITISSLNHYTVPASFPDDTAKTTITTTNHTATASISSYTEIVITRTATGNNYFIPVGFNPSKIEIIAKGAGGESYGQWENRVQSCNTKYSTTTSIVSDKIFKTDASNYGHILEIKRGGFTLSITTTASVKLTYICT